MNISDLDGAGAYAPARIIPTIEAAAVQKAKLSWSVFLILGVLAGAFLSFGGMLATLVTSGAGLSDPITRWIGGLAFSLGMILVTIAGAELFTGNNLMIMAWAGRRITITLMMRSWVLVYLGNFLGAVVTALMMIVADGLAVGETYANAGHIASAKLALEPQVAFMRGVLCNILVCLSVWLTFSTSDLVGKMLFIPLPIAAFFALGFEHSIANMYLLSIAMMSGAVPLDISAFWGNILMVTAGNVVGGIVFVAAIYWLVYRVVVEDLNQVDN